MLSSYKQNLIREREKTWRERRKRDGEKERELGVSTANPLSISKITKTFKHLHTLCLGQLQNSLVMCHVPN